MKKENIFFIPLQFIFILIITTTYSCEEDVTKKDPIITWANPADIVYGTLLSAIQLNATADVSGSFVYTPTIGTKLEIGANQDLKVNFTPNDIKNYNSISKTVKINVTPATDAVIDIDGNIYTIVTIGTQVWMAENLKTTKFNNGVSIDIIENNSVWSGITTPGFCWYDNNELSYKNTYGALYNWYSVNSGNLCPTGWHVPTDAEWTTMVGYLGGLSVAGGKLKETGISHWITPNTGATNESNFNGLPGGSRTENGTFESIGISVDWWSATENNTGNAWYWTLVFNNAGVGRNDLSKNYGFSIRCVKN